MIAAAISDCRVLGLPVTGVEPIELVLPVVIADRCRMSEADLLARVGQSAAVHPKPMSVEHPSGGSGFFRWSEVAVWLAAHGVPQDYDRAIEAANQAVKSTDRADSVILYRLIRAALKGDPPPWVMPSWMVQYAPLIGDTGGPYTEDPQRCAQQVESLLHRLHGERNLALTNLYVFTMATSVAQQVALLTRLHSDGLLSPVVAR